MDCDANSSTSELQNDEESGKLTISREQTSNSSFTLSEADFSLGGGERIMVSIAEE
ncbi:hypothetical protein CK203_103943 [Vitis vinifera]|uniref:Uncharacterized protein n=1 Tax=Vitis vinifera TaxID=29760 RepID=A0A438CUI4_VITVI|nr:hypothetical protein CK203_103943 [Vitis vinifera]